MIAFHLSNCSKDLANIVMMSFVRVYSKAQVAALGGNSKEKVHVFVNPGDNDVLLFRELVRESVKIIVFGNISYGMAELLGISISGLPEEAEQWDYCVPAPVHGFTESSARIQYKQLPDGLECHISDRPLLRYDFADEWNNLGFGHVRTDGSIWSLACIAKPAQEECSVLASVCNEERLLTAYITLSVLGQSEVLWVNREVGLVDTHEFRLIETFVSNYAGDRLPCLPMLREIPYGYDAIFSMRLDCDEDVSTAAPLVSLYREMNVPISLALRTGQPIDQDDKVTVSDVLDCNGSVLSHSVNHKVNWGDDYNDVRLEAENSRKQIRDAFGIEYVDHAVSPFHQNPDYAVSALNDAGYKGFISGIICNDPQYLLARAGRVSADMDIVSHSQQCMLHGDCMLATYNDYLCIYKQSAEYAVKSGAAFGYLDHPFSKRYQYGWGAEHDRIRVHKTFLEFLMGFGKVLFVNEVDLLQHVIKKANTNIWLEQDTVCFSVDGKTNVTDLAYEYKGEICACV